MSAQVAPIASDIVSQVVQSVKTKHISPANVVVLITEVMTLVEQVPGMAGPEKKALAMQVIDRVVAAIPVGQANKDAIAAAVALLAPGIIDAIADAAKGKTGINAQASSAANKACCTVM